MGNQSKIEIILTAIDRGLTTGLGKGQAAVKAFFGTVGSGNALLAAMRSNILQVAGAVAGLSALADVSRMLADADRAAYGMTASLQAANREFGTQVGSVAGWEQAIGRLSEKLRIYAESDLRGASARTIDMTKRLGLNAEQMERIIELSGDLSAGRTDLEGGIERVTSALRGETEASEYLGLTLNENYVKAWHEAHNANQVAWKDLSDLEKAQVRYNVFLEQAIPLQGRAAQSISTYTGAMALVRKVVADAVTTNTDLVAALKQVAVVLQENAQTLGEFAARIATAAGKTIEFIARNQELLLAIGKYGLIFGVAVKVIGTLTLVWKGLNAAILVTTGLRIVPWLRALDAATMASVASVSSLSAGFIGLAGATAAYFAAYKAGEWITMRSAVAGTAEAQKELAKNTGMVTQKLAEISKETGITVSSMEDLNRLVKEGKLHYDQAVGSWKASSAEQKAAIEGVTASSEKQAAALKKSWKAYEDNLKSATTQMEAATSASELNIAQKALEFEQQGMDKREAEVRLTKEKLALLDRQIAKYTELKRSIPSGDMEGKSAADASAEMDQKINGLRLERIGLLRQEVEGNRAAAEESTKKNQQELEDLQKLNAEKLRAASQEKILAMELEKLEASKLPTALQRAEAELAIDRRIMAERINLKQQEIAALKAMEGVDPAEIIRSESELAEMRIDVARQELEGQRAIASARLAAIDDSWRQSAESVAEYRSAVSEAYRLGLMETQEYNERMIAAGNDLGAGLQLGFQRAMDQMRTDAEIMIEIGEQVPDRVAGGLASVFEGAVEGAEAAKNAAIDWARSTINWISQIILKQMLLNALQAAGSAVGGFFAEGGGIQALAGGGSVAGWSPHKKADNILIAATAREFMQPVDAVDYYGLPFMELVRRKLFPRNLAHALAGGTLPSVPSSYRLAQGGQVPGQPQQTTVKTGDTRLRVINVLDKNMVGDYLRTADGETALINMIRRNGTTIRTIIGG